MIRDLEGQTALVDAIIFMILMSLASGIILGSGGGAAAWQSEIEGLQQYSDDFSDTLLAMEVESPNYTDPEGNTITMNGSVSSISQLLSDAAIINFQSAGQANLSSYEAAIQNAGNSLIRPGYGYAAYSHVEGQENQTIFLSNQVDEFGEMPDERYASQRLYEVDDVQVNITIFIWVET